MMKGYSSTTLVVAMYFVVVSNDFSVVNAMSTTCGWLSGCSFHNFDDNDSDRLLDDDGSNVFTYALGDDSDSFSIRCAVVSPINATKGIDWMEFHAGDGSLHKDYAAPYWMEGNLPEWIHRSDYLGTGCPERKQVRVVGRVWGTDQEPCFDVTYELFAECEGFAITVSVDDDIVKPLFTEAAERWSRVITKDLPPVIGFGDFVEPFETCTFSMDVDDVEICGLLEHIDEPVLAYAGPDYLRANGHLPINGLMVIDSNLTSSPDLLRKTILREMGHVLGIGTLWEMMGVAGSNDTDCPYTGTRAVEEFEKISGCDSGLVPLELGGGNDSRCAHWSESCFGDELMTPVSPSNGSGFEPLSQITAASLEDLGYEVSFDEVDTITAHDLASSCRCDVRSSRRRLSGWRQVSKDRPHRRLRKETEKMAKKSALEFLERRNVDTDALPDSVRYVGDKVVIAYVEQEGAIYDVVVTK